MNCKSCGYPNKDDAKLCIKCSSPLKKDKALFEDNKTALSIIKYTPIILSLLITVLLFANWVATPATDSLIAKTIINPFNIQSLFTANANVNSTPLTILCFTAMFLAATSAVLHLLFCIIKFLKKSSNEIYGILASIVSIIMPLFFVYVCNKVNPEIASASNTTGVVITASFIPFLLIILSALEIVAILFNASIIARINNDYLSIGGKINMLIDHIKKYRFLLQELVLKGIRLRYRRSYLGVLWTMFEPLLNMIVLSIIFGPLLGYSDDKTFPVYILSARLLYDFFSHSTRECTRAIRSNASMIKKVYVPKYLYPLSHILYNFVIFSISLLVLAIVSLILGVYPTMSLFTIVIPVLNLMLFTLGVGLILATVGVFFRDMEYLWNIALTLIMYTCAIFYKVERFASDSFVLSVLKLNPLYCIITNFRQSLGLLHVEESVSSALQAFNWEFALYSFLFSLVLIVIGIIAFRKNQDKFILHI